jgi:phosphoribosylamine--glycine ligase/phosphoribosylformylglycinamidine cyclo-ligase
LTWKLAQSPEVSSLFVAPGNGGTAAVAQNVSIAPTDISGLIAFARDERVDLTVVGPEVPLVAGLVGAFAEAGLRAFGPSAAAAQLEGSKAFAKRFMVEEGVPTAFGTIFGDYETALAFLRQQRPPIVAKADGLAAGKGVTVCSTLDEAEAALNRAMVQRAFGDAGDYVLLETCLTGEEASLLAFTDGRTVVPMLPARDYKPVGDGDRGPNTGGMGGYAPSPYLPPTLVEEAVARILEPAVHGMRRRGVPYVGVLYAGLMLTDEGLRVIEFNCRFGDPETQVLLPLLESDLIDVFLACLDERLDEIEIHWRPEHSVCIVLASEGYPGSYPVGKEISGVDAAGRLPGVVVFQAGTKREDGRLVTAGGRVLAVTATGSTLPVARERAQAAVEHIRFEGAHYRGDIGVPQRPIRVQGPDDARREPAASSIQSAYAAAGVDIAAKNRAFAQMREAIHSTYTPAVLAGHGNFGGVFALGDLSLPNDVVLVSSTDGVGTKTMIASAVGDYSTVGHDIVNHCVNDILVQGARPLFFLDYIASGRLEPSAVVAVVESCAQACRANGCVLIGGETAEMPGVYREGTFDLVGTMVGWVERSGLLDGRGVLPWDVCLGLPSSGLHTNGFSLARRVFADDGWGTVLPDLGQPLGEALLTPHRSYLRDLERLWASGVTIKAMAHITGGGFQDNLPRVLPPGTGARIDRTAWTVPAIFRVIQERGHVDEAEMYHVFNMGIGMVLIVSPGDVDRAMAAGSGEAVVIGDVVPWGGDGPRVRV